jgi:hypothetical protein
MVLLLPIGFAILGALIGRWWVVFAALLTWLALAAFLFANDGWYGAGWGDFGIAFNVIAAIATVVGAAVGVGAQRIVAAKSGWFRRPAGGDASTKTATARPPANDVEM